MGWQSAARIIRAALFVPFVAMLFRLLVWIVDLARRVLGGREHDDLG